MKWYRLAAEPTVFVETVSTGPSSNGRIGRSAEAWRRLADKDELVVTSNGKPIAILIATNEGTSDQVIGEVRRARALGAVSALQQQSVREGRGRLSGRDIATEIDAARKARRR